MKILVLVQSIHKFGYEELIKVQRETWDSIPHPDVTVFYYIPNEEKSGIIDNEIYIKDDTSFKHMFRHLVSAFKYVINMEWDYIVKIDNSTYLNKVELVKLLTNKPRTKFYGGMVYKGSEQQEILLWGEAVAYSRDSVQKLIDIHSLYRNDIIGVDDGMSGALLREYANWDTTMELCEFYKNTAETIPLCHAYRCANDEPDKVNEKWNYDVTQPIWREGAPEYKFRYEITAMREIHKQLIGI